MEYLAGSIAIVVGVAVVVFSGFIARIAAALQRRVRSENWRIDERIFRPLYVVVGVGFVIFGVLTILVALKRDLR